MYLECESETGVLIDTDALRNIRASGGAIHIHTQVADGECKIIVTDNGTGMDGDKKSQLFSMSSKATYGTNNEKGVGLGLPLCKEFMERQGGSINIESTPGKGSSFYISIPLGVAGGAVV